MFDRPAAGRAWFERTLPDQLTLGRPDQVAIVFGRRVSRQTPGRFHTKVINRGVEPSIQVHYRASKVKQYFKEGRALRTETTVNDTRDFGIGRRLNAENWDALIKHRPPGQPALPGPPTCGVPVRARRHDAPARGAAIDRRWPTRPRSAFR
jgi:hypothetical protein